MNFEKFVEWGFYGVVGGAAVYAVNILASLKYSIDQLNNRVATIIEKTAWHERELDRHNDRLSRLESHE